jgi:hypothetical protein
VGEILGGACNITREILRSFAIFIQFKIPKTDRSASAHSPVYFGEEYKQFYVRLRHYRRKILLVVGVFGKVLET